MSAEDKPGGKTPLFRLPGLLINSSPSASVPASVLGQRRFARCALESPEGCNGEVKGWSPHRPGTSAGAWEIFTTMLLLT